MGIRLMSPRKTLLKLTSMADALNNIINRKKAHAKFDNGIVGEESNDVNIAPNLKKYRIYNQKDLSIALGLFNTKSLSKLIDDIGVDGIYLNEKNAKIWRFNQLAVNKLLEATGRRLKFVRTDKQSCQVYVVSNLKGGAGKTTSVFNFGAGLANAVGSFYRVGIIDLDPQGSLSAKLVPYLSPDAFTVSDFLCNDLELDEGETFEQIVSESFLETNIPHLRILPASINDIRFEAHVKNKASEAFARNESFSAHDSLEPIIEAVKDQFDIIFIDTPPKVTESVIAAHYSATSLIIPLRPADNDRDSSAKYLTTLSNVYKTLMNVGHKGYNNVRVVHVGVSNSAVDKEISSQVNVALNASCLPDFENSEALKKCDAQSLSVFEISPFDFAKQGASRKITQNGSRTQLEAAQVNLTNIALNIEADMQNVWQNEECGGEL
ncbi:ParA family protein [Psychromonas aquimarina]|uniref:ParA family protein n=1 Tax=Psychromonas aquimarina TaxID=444919 RepID=UPI00041D03CD|nr:ParA family protein [Psychromonas aquimarina]